MSTTPQPPQFDRVKFPGLRPAEASVLRDWLAVHEREYDKFDYNVRMGPGVDPGPDVEGPIREGFILSTQNRADVVAWRGGVPTIIEVKERASASAIGQLVVYAHHFAESFPGAPKPLLLVIARSIVTGLVDAMARQGIQYEQVAARV